MPPDDPIQRAAKSPDDKLYASCKTCGEVAPWVPYRAGQEWECQACRVGTRQFGRADREKYLREKVTPQERREYVVNLVTKSVGLVIGAWITWECLKWFFTVWIPPTK